MKFPITGDEMYKNIYSMDNNKNVPDNNIHHWKQQVLLHKFSIHDLLAFLQYRLLTCWCTACYKTKCQCNFIISLWYLRKLEWWS